MRSKVSYYRTNHIRTNQKYVNTCCSVVTLFHLITLTKPKFAQNTCGTRTRIMSIYTDHMRENDYLRFFVYFGSIRFLHFEGNPSDETIPASVATTPAESDPKSAASEPKPTSTTKTPSYGMKLTTKDKRKKKRKIMDQEKSAQEVGIFI